LGVASCSCFESQSWAASEPAVAATTSVIGKYPRRFSVFEANSSLDMNVVAGR
jgi:hypothetical protein